MKVLIEVLQEHKLAQKNPLMDQQERIALRESLNLHGQFEPILVWRGFIIDGRNRVNQAKELGWLEVDMINLPHKTTSEELNTMVDIKETRRKQSKTQLAMKCALELKKGTTHSQGILAGLNGVGERLVRSAVYILKNNPLAANSFFEHGLYSLDTDTTFYSLGKFVEYLKQQQLMNQGNQLTSGIPPILNPKVVMLMNSIQAQGLTSDELNELVNETVNLLRKGTP